VSRVSDLDIAADMAIVAATLKRRATYGWCNGFMSHDMPYIRRCTVAHTGTGTNVLWTRDTNMHKSGWLKNADYERCLHLSLSTFDPLTLGRGAPMNRKLSHEWCKLFMGDDLRWALFEGPKSEHGIRLGVEHWRLFCDSHWQPFKPRAEVYSMAFTESGWRSASQVLEEDGIHIESILVPG
jgi:hypothetical protein